MTEPNPDNPMPPGCGTVRDLIEGMEARHPGFRELVDRNRAELHARFPDNAERRRFVMSRCVPVDNVLERATGGRSQPGAAENGG